MGDVGGEVTERREKTTGWRFAKRKGPTDTTLAAAAMSYWAVGKGGAQYLGDGYPPSEVRGP